ncbi:MAG: fused MFS/spermidine synthase [Myxococcales bacterium]|nr:fused MFS/spermidine synthase [Myxococcales bacterium]
MRTAAIAPLYVASGFVALGCETLWHRALGPLFGASQAATAVVLGAFMLGLAGGALWGSARVDASAHPLRLYAHAEWVVALSAALLPRVFLALVPWGTGLPMGAKAALAGALVGPATFAMGVTLPALARVVHRETEPLGRTVSVLSTLNLGGAMLGPAAVSFGLVARVGVAHAGAILGAVALAVSMMAFALARHEDAVHEPATQGEADPRPSREVLALALILGTLSFALQLMWNRALALVLGASAYTFAAVTSVIVAALSAGNATSAALPALAPAAWWRRVASHLLSLAITLWLGKLTLHVAPSLIARLVMAERSVLPLRLLIVLVVAGLPSHRVGALFPLLVSQRRSRRVGATVGLVSTVTTVGNALGALLAGFVLVPRFGLERCLLGCAALPLGLSVVAAARVSLDHLRGTALAAVAAMLTAYTLTPRWDPATLSSGTFRVSAYRDRAAASVAEGCDPRRRFQHRTLLFQRDGALGTVVVLGHSDGPECSLYSLRVDGKAEGSVLVAAPLRPGLWPTAPVVAGGDLPTQVLSGALPALFGPTDDVMLIGWGTGLSARALLDLGPRRVTAVELEPAVRDAARLFDARAVDDPRVRWHLDDALTVLASHPDARYDVIASHPSNPWVVGASSLFTDRYFALARSRLRPGGRMLAWVQLYETDPEAVRALVASFVSVFPCSHAFLPGREHRDLVLLGFDDDQARSTAALRARLEARDPSLRGPVLARAGIASDDALMATHRAGPSALQRWSAGVPRHTLDRPWAEFRIADRMLRGDGASGDAVLEGLAHGD